MKPLLVGEFNPYQSNEEDAMRFALHPDPPHASGGRLCRVILGLTERDYLRHFDRTDLCWPKWSLPKAREAAKRIVRARGTSDIIIAFGAKVASAFGINHEPFKHSHAYAYRDIHLGPLQIFRDYVDVPRLFLADAPVVLYLPHPSGLNRAWHMPGAIDRARRLLCELGVPCASPPKEVA